MNSPADMTVTPPSLPGIDKETVVLIAGGSGAIGARTAAVLSRMGARVAVLSRVESTAAAAAAAATSDGEVVGIGADIGQQADVHRAVQAVLDRWGHLDALVNLAAVTDSHGPLSGVTLTEIDTVLRTNLVGALLLSQACAEPMRERCRGSIVNASSIAGRRVTRGHSVYGPAKAAVRYLARQLAGELGPYGIRSNSISPGQTPSNLRGFDEEAGGSPEATPDRPDRPTSTARIPLARRGTLDDYVGATLFLISDLSAYVTGTDIPVDGGASIVR
jgi:NAD(P)-dependent dehydrogenase (short-subunit alcohol dehydrogenase family)